MYWARRGSVDATRQFDLSQEKRNYSVSRSRRSVSRDHAWRGLSGIVTIVLYSAACAYGQSTSVSDREGVTVVQQNGKMLLEYRSQSNPMKLYVSKWFTPAGIQILRDSPHDHVHHRALMFAVGVDGCDFWSEEPADQYGKQVATGALSTSSASSNGDTRVTLQQAIRWDTPQQVCAANESRTIVLDAEANAKYSLLTWCSTLSPPEGKTTIELWGRHYFGLGARFIESMDKGARFVTPGNETGREVRGTEKVTRANWCALYGDADGKPVTVAMFDAPENPRHPAAWFTMTDPFAYLSATLDLDVEKLTVTSDKPLKVCYGVAAWDGHVKKAEIERAYQAWLKKR